MSTDPCLGFIGRKRKPMKRRYTWSHHNREWDMSLLLSNVPVHPNIINGSFAALCITKNKRTACSADDISKNSIKNEVSKFRS